MVSENLEEKILENFSLPFLYSLGRVEGIEQFRQFLGLIKYITFEL